MTDRSQTLQFHLQRFFTSIFKKGDTHMAVFRVEKTRDYTVMLNHHIKNTAHSLRSMRATRTRELSHPHAEN